MATAKQKRRTSTRTNPKAKRINAKKRSASSARPSSLQGKNLERAVAQFQAEPDEKRAHERWQEIEPSIFGVQFKD
jgi:hypothetical protein